ncbi:DUF4185 domain-containing protein [Candidatus Saccharibacteria bacterium]|nr:DUF4185 domain-containing protein [Candidatus Saccharibacteria bacterium]
MNETKNETFKTMMRRISINTKNSKGFTHHFLLPLLAIIAVGSIGAYLVHRGNAATIPGLAGPRSTSEFVSLVRGDIQGRRFVGDGGASVRTGHGYTVSFFGDTVVYKAENIPKAYSEAAGQPTYMMRNNILTISPTRQVKSVVSSADLLKQQSFIDVPLDQQLPGGKNYYWPNAAATDFSRRGKGRTIYLFLGQMHSPESSSSSFNFEYVRSQLAKYTIDDKGTLRLVGMYKPPTYLADTKPITWGTGMLIQGDWTYIYGSYKPKGEWIWGFDHYIARVKTERIGRANEWRFWDGSKWQPSQIAAKPIIDNSTGTEGGITVSRTKTGQYTFVYKKHGFIGNDVYRATATAPQGPWTFSPDILSTPSLLSDTDYTYLAYEIPLAGGKKGAIISHGSSTPVPLAEQGIHALW